MLNTPPSINLAVSSCLLGENVRYDGAHCRSKYINDSLSKYLSLVSVCPENFIGLGTPRPPIQLVQSTKGHRALGIANSTQDVTEQLQQCAHEFLRQNPGLCGFIFKSKSPSCGVASTKLFSPTGQLMHEHANGIFAAAVLAEHYPLAVIGDEKLDEMQCRLEFFTRVYALHHLHTALNSDQPINALSSLHQRYALLLIAISPAATTGLEHALTIANENQADFTSMYVDNFSRIILGEFNRETYVRYLQGSLSTYMNKPGLTPIKTALESYQKAQIEWIDLLDAIESNLKSAGYYFTGLSDELDSLCPRLLMGS